jgi:hypothetical protein
MNTAAYCKIDSSDDEPPPPYSKEDPLPKPAKQSLKIYDPEGYVLHHMKKATLDSHREAGVPEAPVMEEQERIQRNEAELKSMRERERVEAVESEADLLWGSDEEGLELGEGDSGEEEGEEDRDGKNSEDETYHSGDERPGKGSYERVERV